MSAAQEAAGAGAKPIRVMTIWCPDWPVVAARRVGETDDDHVAILRANRVVAASALARAEGVVRAMRRREAQSRCPDIVLLTDDPGRDARAFEPVAAVVDLFTPRSEIVRPGLCQFPTRGPSRYFGGDAALAGKLIEALHEIGVEARIGVADGPFAAALAGRSSTPIVPPNESTAFLAPYAIDALVAVEGGRAVTRAARSTRRASTSGSTDADALALIDLVDLLKRLGIRTLGALAAMPFLDVAARFGPLGERAWRLAAGLDERPVTQRRPPPDVIVSTELDPPVDRVDTAAFLAKALAEELADRLAEHGLACTRISIEAETERGDHLARLWRHERAGATGGLTAAGLADRVRWQLDGWLHTLRKTGDDRSDAGFGGITVLRLVPDEVVPETGRPAWVVGWRRCRRRTRCTRVCARAGAHRTRRGVHCARDRRSASGRSRGVGSVGRQARDPGIGEPTVAGLTARAASHDRVPVSASRRSARRQGCARRRRRTR